MRGWQIIYGALLRGYPASFRAEFGAELSAVFAQALAEAGSDPGAQARLGWRELRDWPASVLAAHLSGWQDTGEATSMTEKTEAAQHDGQARESWAGTVAGALPFLLFGLACILNKLPGRNDWYEFPAFYLLILIGVCVGWVRGFPRWSLTYLGWGLVFAWWWSSMGVGGLGQRLGYNQWTDQWGWAAWAPLGLAAAVGLLISRSLRPLRTLARRLWQDWTWVSLGAYILLAWLGLVADENHHPYLLALIGVSTLAATAGAMLYLRGDSVARRGGGLLVGLIFLVLIGGYAESTWDWRAYYGLPAAPYGPWLDFMRSVVVLAVWASVLLGPALMGQWLRQRRHGAAR